MSLDRELARITARVRAAEKRQKEKELEAQAPLQLGVNFARTWVHPSGKTLNYPPPGGLQARSRGLIHPDKPVPAAAEWGCANCQKYYPTEQGWLMHRGTCPGFYPEEE